MKRLLFIYAAASLLILVSCTSKKQKEEKQAEPVVEKEVPVDTFVKNDSLAKMAEKYGFKVGGCISYGNLGNAKYTSMLKNDFNTTTATNEFKAYSLLSQQSSAAQNKPVMNYTQADAIAKFAQENGIGIRGHVLVWDAYMTDWFFREGFTTGGNYVDSETMKERLRYYIDEVITHFETNFPGVVYCWDVVNEAVADNADEWIEGSECHLRKTRSGTSNIFNDRIGSDYVYFAFKCARNTVNKLNADIKLFYNDYNTFYTEKRNAICNLIKEINANEKLCDGIGMQGYIGGYGTQNGCMNQNDLALIKQAIQTYSDLGLEVQLTEVAVRNYSGEEDVMAKHAQFYGSLFKVLINARQNGCNFTGITIWGLTDDPYMSKTNYSYKMNGPYCGLYSKYFDLKDSYKEVYKALEG